MTICKCKNCKHFRLHYVRRCDGFYMSLEYGHCVYPRLKHRQPHTLACVHYKPREMAADDGEKTSTDT